MSRTAFIAGTVVTTLGVALETHDFFTMAGNRFMMVGAPMSAEMIVGMVAAATGLLVAVAGLVPWGTWSVTSRERVRVTAPAGATLTPAHRRLVAALFLALVIDTMKPASIAFILPGLRREYGLTPAVASLLPVVALAGTVLGSLMWGALADRIGRRATILLSTIMFISTTICGAMPTFTWNVVMCGLMGTAAGGLLPIAYALLAECVPARSRGRVMVVEAGLATALGYLATSGLAALLLGHFGWRIMWFIQFPFAAVLIVVNRWIPESPRFLVDRGRSEQALDILDAYGMRLTDADDQAPVPKLDVPSVLGPQLRARTLVLGLFATSWGLVNWGFITFVPTLVDGVGGGSRLVFLSSTLSVPTTALVAWLYARWRPKRAMAVYATATACSLGVLGGVRPDGRSVLLPIVLAVLLTGTSSIAATLAPYAAEIYPTAVRGTGSGVAAACGKAGGIFGPPAIALLGELWGLPSAAIVVAVPMACAALLMSAHGTNPPATDDENEALARDGEALAA